MPCASKRRRSSPRPTVELLEDRLMPGDALGGLVLTALSRADDPVPRGTAFQDDFDSPEETTAAADPKDESALLSLVYRLRQTNGYVTGFHQQLRNVRSTPSDRETRAVQAPVRDVLGRNPFPNALDQLAGLLGASVAITPSAFTPLDHAGESGEAGFTPVASPSGRSENLGPDPRHDATGLTAAFSLAVGRSVAAATTGPETLVATASTWKYLDDGSNQGTAWRAPGFNDSTWACGPARLGDGDGDEATVVSFGPNPGNKYVTTYFRHSFTVADASRYDSLALRLLRDDGAVVYLNGTEVFRSNMPAGTIGYLTLASTGISGAGESTFVGTGVNPNRLVNGTNVFAVEVHQSSVTSSDVSFDLELTGTVLGPPVPNRIAVIGDYSAGQALLDVSNQIKSWNLEYIATVGDNNYPTGSAATIDANIGQYFHSYISPYVGSYGPGASTNRFFPALGNHDWDDPTGAAPYLSYFTLPGNERYYDVALGPLVRLFVLDSDVREPDGITSTSLQAQWLQSRLAAATEPWKLVAMHHAPYSSGVSHGSTTALQWPFQQWGATAVLAGHDHNYERLLINGLPYFVDGLGGRSITGFSTVVPGSRVRYNGDYGAMMIDASPTSLTFQFITRTGLLIDSYTIASNQILDNGDASFSTTAGFFPLGGEGFQDDVHYAAAGGGGETASWSFGISPGRYRVSATWSAYVNRATNAPFTVLDAATPRGTVPINQELEPDDFSDAGAFWEDLGTFSITGTTLVVRLSDLADEFVIADAIRVARV